MSNKDRITNYAREVADLVPGNRAQRKRVFEELEADIAEAAAVYEREGLDGPDAAARAVADFGAPSDVAAGFAPAAPPPRRRSGVRRWLPLAMPLIAFALALLTLVSQGSAWLAEGATQGERVALRFFIGSTIWFALLAAVAFAAIRRADRDAAWRIAAWAPTALILLPIVTRLATPLFGVATSI